MTQKIENKDLRRLRIRISPAFNVNRTIVFTLVWRWTVIWDAVMGPLNPGQTRWDVTCKK